MSDDTITTEEDVEIGDALLAMNLIKPYQPFYAERLSGGVSCDVYCVEVEGKTYCLKRALPKLRVEADWQAPVERSWSEVAWLRLAGTIAPDNVPAILGEDHDRHMFAMEYFRADEYPVWKQLLAADNTDPDFAGQVGDIIARIHAATAGRPDIATAFANDALFLSLRLDPYLLYTATKHDDVAPQLRALADGVAKARVALMHGDVSPKNILVGRTGPVFLDAETACYGDPAFDLAFCLTHLLLKGVWHPEWTMDYLDCFAELKSAYLDGVDWEDAGGLETRTVQLVSGLLLARVDGKSPVEYLTEDAKRAFVRDNAKRMLLDYPANLDDLSEQWGEAITREIA
jgi:aminoglycoside phosphotransferase (APT) family kinase protein